MPLYETVMQEKPPIVLDIGTAYTKLGFAAEAYPRKIIPSELILSTNGQTKRLFLYETVMELYDQMVDFLQIIFFKHLLVSPKERKVVIVENSFGQTVVRETLARVLFRHFEVSSVMFLPSHLASLSSLAVGTAIVVDIGYSETTVMPIFCGVQIMQAFQDQGYGGKMIHQEIKKQLIDAKIKGAHDIPEDVLEDIKVRTCFVTTLERANSYKNNHPPELAPPDIEYPVTGDNVVTIPGRLRETVFETMFQTTNNNERDSLPDLILNALLKCPLDIRRQLAESIFVIGGSAIIMGLLPRLKAELLFLLKHDDEYKTKFHADIQFKFHKPIGRQNFSAWLGGSLTGGTDLITTRSLTREAYIKNNRVPDWICISDNRQTGS